MNGLPAATPIYLFTEPVDFRKGFDGLTGIVTTSLGKSVTDEQRDRAAHRDNSTGRPRRRRRIP